QVRALRCLAGETVRAVVGLVAVLPARRGLDLGALSPLVVARDRDEIGGSAEGRAPHGVVGRALEPRLDADVAGGRGRLVAGPDRRCANDIQLVRLGADATEAPAAVQEDVVRV